MKRLLLAAAVLAAAALLGGLGYLAWTGSWPSPGLNSVALHQSTERKVLYWKHPDGIAEYAASPAKTGDGRAYQPVYDDEEPPLPGEERVETKAASADASPKGERRILYYRNPMGLADTSPVPKKDWMGMDYIPVYEGEEQEDGSSIKIGLDRVQRSGVRTEIVEVRRLSRPVKAPGVATYDERTLHAVTLRADAFIEKLYVEETGAHVKAGDPLFRIYSPVMVNAQVDYRISLSADGAARAASLKGAEQKLRNYEIPDEVLRRMRETGDPVISIDWPAPASGVVVRKNVVEGQMVRMGEEIFRLADLSRIWVIADVAEQDLGLVRIGQPARLTLKAYPGEIFEGKVTFILHELDMSTRTGKVRIEIENADHRIKHEMFASVEIDAGADDSPRIAVPNSAIIHSGERQVVIVARGEGRFEPRAVKLGLRGEAYSEIKEGIAAGEEVVVAANFLIDAESNLKAALSAFTAGGPTAPPTKSGAPPTGPISDDGASDHGAHSKAADGAGAPSEAQKDRQP